MRIFKHRREWAVYGFMLQEDSCCEHLGVWWPGWALHLELGALSVVIARDEEEM